jgi:hypothetical protein
MTAENSMSRKELVTDTVLYIIGVWVAMLSYFVKLPSGHRQVEIAYLMKQGEQTVCGNSETLSRALPSLLKGSGLLPSSEDITVDQQGSFGSLDSVLRNFLSSTLVDKVAANNHTKGSANNPGLPVALAARLATLPNNPAQLWGAPPARTPHLAAYPSSHGAPVFYSQSDQLESLTIKHTVLNAHTLSSLGGVQIFWTLNLSRHLLLSRFRGQYILEIFALPCLLKGCSKSLQAAGVSADLTQEIQESYSVLFNLRGTRVIHRRFGGIVGLGRWCWCRSCALRRLSIRELGAHKRNSLATRPRTSKSGHKPEYDPILEDLMDNPDPQDWSYELFPHLWARITALEEHLVTAKPWNFWVLFRDRRDTLQFWTFL